jgi:hypothetical protein
MFGLWRRSGWLLVGLGALHLAVFGVVGHQAVAAIMRAGLVASLSGANGPVAERQLFWYGGVFTGVGLVALGLAVQHIVKTTGRPAPRYLGWCLTGLGALGCLVDPASGAWLVVAFGLVMALAPADPKPEPSSAR